MRTAPRLAKARRRAMLAIPFSFQCTCCAVVEHRPTPALPAGWATEEIGSDIYAFCPGCAIDLPAGQEPLQ